MFIYCVIYMYIYVCVLYIYIIVNINVVLFMVCLAVKYPNISDIFMEN